MDSKKFFDKVYSKLKDIYKITELNVRTQDIIIIVSKKNYWVVKILPHVALTEPLSEIIITSFDKYGIKKKDEVYICEKGYVKKKGNYYNHSWCFSTHMGRSPITKLAFELYLLFKPNSINFIKKL
jgi:hypothetical protein